MDIQMMDILEVWGTKIYFIQKANNIEHNSKLIYLDR